LLISACAERRHIVVADESPAVYPLDAPFFSEAIKVAADRVIRAPELLS